MISQSPLTSQVSSGGDGATASPIPLLGDTSSLSKEEETQLGVAGLHLVCEPHPRDAVTTAWATFCEGLVERGESCARDGCETISAQSTPPPHLRS